MIKTTDEIAAELGQDRRRELLYIARNLLGQYYSFGSVPRDRAREVIEAIDKEIDIEGLHRS